MGFFYSVVIANLLHRDRVSAQPDKKIAMQPATGWYSPPIGGCGPRSGGDISPPGVPFFPKEGEYPSATTTPFVIPAQAGIQLTHCVNLCHLALLRKFAFANWIPRVRGMTTARHSAPLGRGTVVDGGGGGHSE